MTASFLRHDRHGARPAKWIEHDVAAIRIEFDEAIDQFFREGSRMAVWLRLGSLPSATWWIKTFQKRLTALRFRRDLPEAVGEPDKLLAGDVGEFLVAFEGPRAFGKDEYVLPTWQDVRIARAFPRTPRGAAAHGLFVPEDLRAHEETQVAELRSHVVMDRFEILDAGRRDVEGESASLDEDAVEFAPDRQEPGEILGVGHAVVVAIVIEPDVVRRRRDGQMHALIRHVTEDVAAIAVDDAVLPGGFLHAPVIAQQLARRKRNLLQSTTMKNLVLVGFMGSGKTDAGKLAAARLGMKFVDMDDVIEQRHNQTISGIFETKGEAFFRQQERALVRELAAEEDQVIATGGGIVLDANNLRDFGRTGVVICCWVDAGVAHERTKHAKHRPLLEEADADRRTRIETLLRDRELLYKAIPLRIDTSAMTVEQQAGEIVRIYKQETGL